VIYTSSTMYTLALLSLYDLCYEDVTFITPALLKVILVHYIAEMMFLIHVEVFIHKKIITMNT
jgi:hypothetical protein